MSYDKHSKEHELLEKIEELIQEGTDTYRQGNSLEIPAWDVSIQVEINQLSDNGAVINYYLDSPQWDRQVFECCAGAGQDQQMAIGMAQGSFVFGMLDGIRAMAQEAPLSEMETEFADSRHEWEVYQSNLVGMGDMPQDTDAENIWELLQDEIQKRIGGQKLCYVKAYCAKNGDEIIGECRINDMPIPELGKIMSDYARSWKTKGFGSQKQFFFLLQKEETHIPYPYTEEDIAEAVHMAISLYHKCINDESDTRYLELLQEELEDSDLVEELRNFLPEMCAQHAFPAIQCGEKIGICCGDVQTDVYKTQLASYYFIYKALVKELYDDFPNELFSALVSTSSMYNAVSRAKEKGAFLDEGGKMFISYGFSDNYQLR